MIRSTAAWAIGKIAGQKAKEVLQNAYENETEAEVKMEINKALQN